MLKKLPSLTVLLGNIVVLAGLALLAYLGFYNRYWADDWCYSADARTLGTWGSTAQYFQPQGTGFSTNRYSLTFFSALIENTLGMFGNQIVATLTILLWLIGLFWIGYNISRLVRSLPKSALLLGAGFLLYYNLFLSPQRFQILYWRSGVLPYSTAIIFWLFMLGLMTYQMIREKPVLWPNIVIAPLAFLAGGLGEISCVYIFSGTAVLFILAWFARRKGQAWAVKSFPTISMGLLFLFLAMAALIISPSNARVVHMETKRSSPYLIPFVSIRFAFDFILGAISSFPLPNLILMVGLATLAMITASTQEEQKVFHTKNALWLALATIGITFLLIVAIQTPAVYFYSAPPDPRGQSLSLFTLLAGLSVLAWIAGRLVAVKWSTKWLIGAAALGLLVCLAYTARTMSLVYAELPGFQSRAQVWDERTAIIEKGKAQGLTNIPVPVIDTAGIHTRDMFGSKGKGMTEFSNNCAARYYGVEGLKANVP